MTSETYLLYAANNGGYMGAGFSSIFRRTYFTERRGLLHITGVTPILAILLPSRRYSLFGFRQSRKCVFRQLRLRHRQFYLYLVFSFY